MAGSSIIQECPTVDAVEVRVYEVPTDQPEADGTLEWSSTTVVVVELRAGDRSGLGWTYAGTGSAKVVSDTLADICVGAAALDVPGLNERMARACRNLGRPGLVACAISAVDIAAWDLKARLLEVPLAALFGQVRQGAPIYGSGGFTTYDEASTRAQLEQWTEVPGTSRGSRSRSASRGAMTQDGTWPGWHWHGRSSATTWNCTWTPMVATPANRRCGWASSSTTSTTLSG